jgi:hypothetical protein
VNNAITVKDVHPIPSRDESFLLLNGSTIYSQFDLKLGYWQIPLDKESKEKTAFATQHDLFHWNVLPFSRTNAPAAF